MINVPVFQPVTSSFYRTVEEWAGDPQGLKRDIAWCVFLPEFEGGIKPIFIAGAKREGELEIRVPVEDRCRRLAERVSNWIHSNGQMDLQRGIGYSNPEADRLVEAAAAGLDPAVLP